MIWHAVFRLYDSGESFKKIYEKLSAELGLVPGRHDGSLDKVLVHESKSNGGLGAYRVHFFDRSLLARYAEEGKFQDHDLIQLSYWLMQPRVNDEIIKEHPMKDAVRVVTENARDCYEVDSEGFFIDFKSVIGKKYLGNV